MAATVPSLHKLGQQKLRAQLANEETQLKQTTQSVAGIKEAMELSLTEINENHSRIQATEQEVQEHLGDTKSGIRELAARIKSEDQRFSGLINDLKRHRTLRRLKRNIRWLRPWIFLRWTVFPIVWPPILAVCLLMVLS